MSGQATARLLQNIKISVHSKYTGIVQNQTRAPEHASKIPKSEEKGKRQHVFFSVLCFTVWFGNVPVANHCVVVVVVFVVDYISDTIEGDALLLCDSLCCVV